MLLSLIGLYIIEPNKLKHMKSLKDQFNNWYNKIINLWFRLSSLDKRKISEDKGLSGKSLLILDSNSAVHMAKVGTGVGKWIFFWR